MNGGLGPLASVFREVCSQLGEKLISVGSHGGMGCGVGVGESDVVVYGGDRFGFWEWRRESVFERRLRRLANAAVL